MSALAPKADIARPPLACPVSAISGHRPASFDQLVGAQDQTGWYLEAEGLRSPEIDYHLQLRRLLNRQVGRHERDQASTVGRPQSLRWWWGLRRDFTTVGSVRDLMLPEAITRLPPCAQNAGRGRRPARNRGHGKSVCGLAGIVETEMQDAGHAAERLPNRQPGKAAASGIIATSSAPMTRGPNRHRSSRHCPRTRQRVCQRRRTGAPEEGCRPAGMSAGAGNDSGSDGRYVYAASRA
jgi:hypothetical protein